MKPRALVGVGVTVLFLLSLGRLASAEIVDVVWVNAQNASVGVGNLSKTSGTDGWNAGASASRVLSSGDGSFEFVCGPSVGLYTVGLSESDRTLDPAEMAYAIQLDELGT